MKFVELAASVLLNAVVQCSLNGVDNSWDRKLFVLVAIKFVMLAADLSSLSFVVIVISVAEVVLETIFGELLNDRMSSSILKRCELMEGRE